MVALIGSMFFYFNSRENNYIDVFEATANQDCAPWDGSAFSLSVPYDTDTVIYISIWQVPDIKVPATFTFPNETGQNGHAYILPELDPFIQLSGEVLLQRAEYGSPVEGEFNLMDSSGDRFKGKFIAEWGGEVVYCG